MSLPTGSLVPAFHGDGVFAFERRVQGPGDAEGGASGSRSARCVLPPLPVRKREVEEEDRSMYLRVVLFGKLQQRVLLSPTGCCSVDVSWGAIMNQTGTAVNRESC